MDSKTSPLMVTIQCFTYNQEIYIKDCLDGFVKQKTSFRFEAIVHDDASTDNTPSIIREYAERYPNIIKPIFESENLYSKHDGALQRVVDEQTCGKYVAFCEGDDFWTDPLKLQKQYDFMESHPECSLCFHANTELLNDGTKKLHRPSIIKTFYTTEDVILGGGGFMATNTMFYRWDLVGNIEKPDFWKESPVGDAPCMLFLASKGKVGYIDDDMSVYRICAVGSWSTRPKSIKIRNGHIKAIAKMFDQFDKFTEFKYHKSIKIKKRKNSWNCFIDNVISIFFKFKLTK